MSGYLSVTRLIAASQYCGVRFGVSKVRKVISFAPLPWLVSLTEHAVSPEAATKAATTSTSILVTAPTLSSRRCDRRPGGPLDRMYTPSPGSMASLISGLPQDSLDVCAILGV